MKWNAVRYDGSAHDHVESFFVKATSPDARRAIWLRATIFSAASGEARAEAWAIAFDRDHGHRAAKHTVPYAEASFGRDDLDASWSRPSSDDHMQLTSRGSKGVVTMDQTRIEWDLRFEGSPAPFVMLPAHRLYDSGLLSGKTVTPRPDLRVSGEVHVQGRAWALDGWHGMQGHNWQRKNPELYAWTHCNQWNEPPEKNGALVIEAVSARYRVGRWMTPPLTTLRLRHEGRDHAFNGPLQILRSRTELGLRRYGVTASGPSGRVEAVMDADIDDFVGLHYPNPDGSMTYCLNAKLARARVRFEPVGGPAVAVSTSAAALEIATRRSDHGVRMML